MDLKGLWVPRHGVACVGRWRGGSRTHSATRLAPGTPLCGVAPEMGSNLQAPERHRGRRIEIQVGFNRFIHLSGRSTGSPGFQAGGVLFARNARKHRTAIAIQSNKIPAFAKNAARPPLLLDLESIATRITNAIRHGMPAKGFLITNKMGTRSMPQNSTGKRTQCNTKRNMAAPKSEKMRRTRLRRGAFEPRDSLGFSVLMLAFHAAERPGGRLGA